MMATGEMTRPTAMEYIRIATERDMRVNGTKTCSTGKGPRAGQTGLSSQGSTLKAVRTELASTCGPTAHHMKGNGVTMK